MDPDLVAVQFLEAVCNKDWEAMSEHAENLADWIRHSGWIPDRIWALCPNLSRKQIIKWLDHYAKTGDRIRVGGPEYRP